MQLKENFIQVFIIRMDILKSDQVPLFSLSHKIKGVLNERTVNTETI